MKLHELYPFPEERKSRKRLGRGRGTGQGCTAGKGNKGQNARAGGGTPAWFEGGQMPLARRLPKRGFKNFDFKVTYAPINLDRLFATFPGKTEITLDDIYASGLCAKNVPVKILSLGEGAAVTVEAHRFSAKAAEKLVAAGGRAVILEAKDASEPVSS